MNEFIVWYRNSKTNELFSREFTLNDLVNQLHLDIISDSPNMRDYHILCMNESVRKNDIEGNTIYVKSSIVEFGIIFEGKNIGYFVFDNTDLKYKINIIQSEVNYNGFYSYNNEEMGDFKIIDTIQENKLKLIKE